MCWMQMLEHLQVSHRVGVSLRLQPIGPNGDGNGLPRGNVPGGTEFDASKGSRI